MKLWVHEADHSHTSCAKVNNEWSCAYTPPVFCHGIHKDNFSVLCSMHSNLVNQVVHCFIYLNRRYNNEGRLENTLCCQNNLPRIIIHVRK